MPSLTAVFDACVLYPAPLRDLLMQLALTDLFRARWTEDIQEEWIRNLLENRTDLKRSKLEHTRDLMNQNIRDCLVTDYHSLIPSLTLPDPKDRHVLAAAIATRADVIVTFNLKDFPASALAAYRIETQTPDEFILRLLDSSQETVFLAVRRQRQSLKNPPKSVEEILVTLQQQGLSKTTAHLRLYSQFL